jgi:predicted alpha/beta-hydrolase family hydrolase
MRSSERVEVGTEVGTARLTVLGPDGRARGTLALGHGAGGGIEAIDLVAVAGAAVAAGWRVVLVEQPWRVLGRRVAAPPPRLDRAWTAALAGLEPLPGAAGRRLVLGGRSAGARVACRTATALSAAAVVCLAFPLHPPGRPERSRAQELAQARVPLLVVQGRRDAFGTPQEVLLAAPRDAAIVAVDGDHGLTADPAAVAAAVRAFLDDLAGMRPGPATLPAAEVPNGSAHRS